MRDVTGYHDARPIKTLAGIACAVPAVYVGAGSFSQTIELEKLGYTGNYSLAAARSVMWNTLNLSSSSRALMADRCRMYAEAHLDQDKIANDIADKLEDDAQETGGRERSLWARLKQVVALRRERWHPKSFTSPSPRSNTSIQRR